MRLRLIRHATLVVEYGERRLLVDPMLDDAGARPPVVNTPSQRENPLVPLPVPAAEVARDIDAVLATHLHADHWDATAAAVLDPSVPLVCQTEDVDRLGDAGFTELRPVANEIEVAGIRIARTPCRHGTGEIAERMAPASGYVLRATGEPVVYLAGDTIWCPEVDEVLGRDDPAIVVVNAGGARFLEGDPITMDAADVVATCQAAPNARFVAVHMESINHCLVTRDDLATALRAAAVDGQVSIPADGAWVDLDAEI
jgi:L-ascorbate metabolism protein UlaG (beta-lactamase superfamily)